MPKQEIDILSLQLNPFDLIGNKWELLTAGTPEQFNTMTVSWGNMGVLWNKNICTVFVRPQRYTLEFIEREEYFSVCTFNGHKDALALCGSKSGRDLDKIAASGLTPAFYNGIPYFEEADLVFICKKLSVAAIQPTDFLDPSLDSKYYPEKDYHRVFTAEIVSVLR